MEKYFITCDLESTGKTNQDIQPLVSTQMTSIRDNISHLIQSSFSDVECKIIQYDAIMDYFSSKQKADEFIISLDNGIYIPNADMYFDSTRVYKSKEDVTNKSKSYVVKRRDGSDLWTQNQIIVDTFKKSWKKEVVICDDGIFTWDTLTDVITILNKNWIEVSKIRTVLNFNENDNLGGIKIESMYREKSCKDWIDERDFFYWVNMSGASFMNNKWEINGLPYISSQWVAHAKATIPEEISKEFCQAMIWENINYWEKMNQKNSTNIVLQDIPRITYLSEQYDVSQSIIDILNSEKQKI